MKPQRELKYPPLADKFTKFGDEFEKVAHNPENGMYCYKRTTPTGRVYYEVFKAPTAIDENGDRYPRYPSTSEFGNGSALCIRGDEKDTADKIARLMAQGFQPRS